MATRLDLPSAKRIEEVLLHTPSPPPMSATFPPASMSRSSSYHGQELKRLVLKGQLVNIVLPDAIPDLEIWIEDLVSAVKSIHHYDDEDVPSVLRYATDGRFIYV